MQTDLHVIIAGAGIGGLSTALSLSSLGWRVTLIERSSEFGDVGAGLQLSPNATSILRYWDILESLNEVALVPEALRLRCGRTGQDILRMPLAPLAELRWGAPYLVVHRADLHQCLMNKIQNSPLISLRQGWEVTGFSSSNTQVHVALQTGGGKTDSLTGHLLVGADGLRSIIRRWLSTPSEESPLFWSGLTAWRALIPLAQAPSHARRLETNIWMGPRTHLVHYPIRRGELINIVAVTENHPLQEYEDSFFGVEKEGEAFAPSFKKWHEEAKRLIAQAPLWRQWPLFDCAPIKYGCNHSVTLVGDAAHPMLPFMAQGAAQAIEDAFILGEMLHQTAPHISEGLKAYAALRGPRTQAIQILSRRQGKLYHMRGLGARVRNLLIKTWGFERLMCHLDWLYAAHGSFSPSLSSSPPPFLKRL